MENDTSTGGEPLTMDAAVKALVTAENAQQTEADATDSENSGDAPADASDAIDHDPDADNPDNPEDGLEDEEDEEDDIPEDDANLVADSGRVRLDDGSIVSVADLKKGSLFHADYTRKTQEVAALRRTVESQSAVANRRDAHLLEQVDYVTGVLRSMLPVAPDTALLATDPVAYMRQKALHERWSNHLDVLHQQRQRSQSQRQALTQSQRDQRATAEWGQMVEKLPHLKDEKRIKAFGDEVQRFGAQYGFSASEISEAGFDHRQLLVLDKAIRWDKLQASKARIPARVEGRPPVKTSGKRLSADARRARDASGAMERLRSTGRLDDAVRALLATAPKG